MRYPDAEDETEYDAVPTSLLRNHHLWNNVIAAALHNHLLRRQIQGTTEGGSDSWFVAILHGMHAEREGVLSRVGPDRGVVIT